LKLMAPILHLVKTCNGVEFAKINRQNSACHTGPPGKKASLSRSPDRARHSTGTMIPIRRLPARPGVHSFPNFPRPYAHTHICPHSPTAQSAQHLPPDNISHLPYNTPPMSNSLLDLIDQLPQSRILLLGDLMLDRYIFGNADRLSPEAPVPVLHFQHEEYRLGGAGSVLADLAALGAQVSIVAVLGRDEASKEVRKHLAAAGADGRGI